MRRDHRRFLATIVAGLAALGGSSIPAAGQIDRGGSPDGSGRPQPPPAEGLISVQFGGGSVADYVDLLRGAMKPRPANIALSESAAGAVLPQVQLDAVTLGTALGAIEYIAPSGPGERWEILHLNKSLAEPPAYAVTLVRSAPAGPDGGMTTSVQPSDQGRMLQVFSIKELIDPPMPGGPTPQTVLSAVDLALRMAQEGGKQPPAEVKFHPESGLIILEAPPQQIGAIENLLGRIRGDVQRQRDWNERTGRQRLDDEMAMRVSTAKVQSCQARLDFLKQSFDKATQLHDSGNVSDDEVRSTQMQLVNAKSDLDIASAEAQTAKARLESEQAGPGPGGPGSPGGDEAAALRGQVSDLQQQVAGLQAKIKELESKKK